MRRDGLKSHTLLCGPIGLLPNGKAWDVLRISQQPDPPDHSTRHIKQHTSDPRLTRSFPPPINLRGGVWHRQKRSEDLSCIYSDVFAQRRSAAVPLRDRTPRDDPQLQFQERRTRR